MYIMVQYLTLIFHYDKYKYNIGDVNVCNHFSLILWMKINIGGIFNRVNDRSKETGFLGKSGNFCTRESIC